MSKKLNHMTEAVSGNYMPRKVADQIWEEASKLKEDPHFLRGVSFMLDFLTDEDDTGSTITEYYNGLEELAEELPKPVRDLLKKTLEGADELDADVEVHVIKMERN
jgi:hypothetical protein